MCFKLKIQTKIHTFYPDPQIESMMSLYIKEGTCPHTCRPFLDFCNKKVLNAAIVLLDILKHSFNPVELVDRLGDMLKWHIWTNEEYLEG